MKRRFWLTFTLAAALALGFGSLALAESAEEPPPAEAAAEPAERPMPMYGMQAWIDPETGELRGPTAAEAAEIAAQWQAIFGKAKTEPKVFTYKSGMMSIDLDPSIMKFSVVRVDADGHLEADCAQGPHKALEFVETAASQPAREEK